MLGLLPDIALFTHFYTESRQHGCQMLLLNALCIVFQLNFQIQFVATPLKQNAIATPASSLRTGKVLLRFKGSSAFDSKLPVCWSCPFYYVLKIVAEVMNGFLIAP